MRSPETTKPSSQELGFVPFVWVPTQCESSRTVKDLRMGPPVMPNGRSLSEYFEDGRAAGAAMRVFEEVAKLFEQPLRLQGEQAGSPKQLELDALGVGHLPRWCDRRVASRHFQSSQMPHCGLLSSDPAGSATVRPVGRTLFFGPPGHAAVDWLDSTLAPE